MVINRNNYETYLVDYAEGSLSSELVLEMEKFLEANPDIKDELELFIEAPLIDNSITFDAKEGLKNIPFEKTYASSDYFQNQCVAYVEGLMPENEIDFFLELVKNDKAKRKELQLFQKTLLPKEDAVFAEKILLKREIKHHKIDDNNYEEYCVACVEGWLNHEGMVALNEFIAEKPERKLVLEMYQKTKLVPDLSIVYPDKVKIKKYRILNFQSRKIMSYAASVAAVIVFGVMAFYTTKLDNPTQLTSSINETTIATETNSEVDNVEPTKIQEENNSRVKQILHDPFGYEKVSVKEPSQTEDKIELERIDVDKITPIQLSKLDCKPCKIVFDTDPEMVPMQTVEIANLNNKEIQHDTEKNAAVNDIAWNIAQAGITGINKISNAKIKVEKEQKTQKTKIQFKSKYFAFSTNVKSK